MTDIEVALTDLGEIATRELAKEHRLYRLEVIFMKNLRALILNMKNKEFTLILNIIHKKV